MYQKIILIVLTILVIIGMSMFLQSQKINKDVKIGDLFLINTDPELMDINNELIRLLETENKVVFSTNLGEYFLRLKHRTVKDDSIIVQKEGKQSWRSLFDFPGNDVEWLVLENDYKQGGIYQLFQDGQNNIFSKYYSLQFQGENARIYKRISNNEKFVTAYRGQLLRGFDKFVAKGINAYNLIYYKQPGDIDKAFQTFKSVGINTVRFWAFEDNVKKDEVRTITKKRLRNLDLIFAAADKYKIYLVPVLSNNWDDFGGKKNYLFKSKIGIKNGGRDLFFSKKKPQQLFINHIKYVVGRAGKLNAAALYKDSQYLLAWEIMNEPRISPDKNNTLRTWTDTMAKKIKSIDDNHLVFIGTEEEVQTQYDSDRYKPKDLCSLESLDVCSTHLYLYNAKKKRYNSLKEVEDFLNQQKKSADIVDKPLLLGEFGISEKDKPFGVLPTQTMRDIARIAVKSRKLSGYLVWDWDPLYYYDPMGFSDNNNAVLNLTALKSIIDNDVFGQ